MLIGWMNDFTFYDDGNWRWKYECQYVTPTNNPKDYVYEIAFETKDGGIMDGNDIRCYYWKEENILGIVRKGNRINFHVEGFGDIKKILNPMIKANDAKPYPIYESNRKVRKDKLKIINRNGKQ